MSTCTCYDTYIYDKLSLILPVIGLHYQLYQQVILHEVVVLDKNPGRQSSHHPAWLVSNAAARSRRPCVCAYSPGVGTWKKTIKRALQYVRWLTTLKPVGSILTYAHIPSPNWRQRRKSYSDAVEFTIKKQASCQRSAARRSNGAKPEETHQL